MIKWLSAYICDNGCTLCMEHVVRSLYAEMAEEWNRETENLEGDVFT